MRQVKKMAGINRPEDVNVITANMNVYAYSIARFRIGKKVITIRKTRVNEIVFGIVLIVAVIAAYTVLSCVLGVDDYAARLGG